MQFDGNEGTRLHAEVAGYSVFTAPEWATGLHWSGLQEWRRGTVYFDDPGEFAPNWFTPAQARELAAALLRAADETEGKPTERRGTWKIPPAGPEGTRRTAANLDGSRPENQEDNE
jgi:hypothetical protein